MGIPWEPQETTETVAKTEQIFRRAQGLWIICKPRGSQEVTGSASTLFVLWYCKCSESITKHYQAHYEARSISSACEVLSSAYFKILGEILKYVLDTAKEAEQNTKSLFFRILTLVKPR